MKAPRITKEDVLKKMEAGEDLLLIDARNDADYLRSESRLPGAVRVALEEIESFGATIDAQRQVVIYCT
ncbi:MAG: rhodanese-like domain-containing protein [Deltaproteobacteria bacterium]